MQSQAELGIPTSLREEGWAMLACIAQLLAAEGHNVTIAVNPQLQLPHLAQVHAVPVPTSTLSDASHFPPLWSELADQSDLSIVIAPEFDWLLSGITSHLRSSGAVLLNCFDPFVNHASDKLQTAELLRKSGISHPPTVLLASLDDSWLVEQATSILPSETLPQWVVKMRTGAGCEQLSRHSCRTRHELMAELTKIYPDKSWQDLERSECLIVQPWFPGTAYSCSAVVDQHGQARWMPIMSQVFSSEFKYAGSIRAPQSIQRQKPLQLLNETILALGSGALGWVGIDLQYDNVQHAWHVIEVNPRCTTSLVELAQDPRVAQEIAHAFINAAHV